MKKITPLKDFIVMQIPKIDTSIVLPDGVNGHRESYLVAVAVGPDVKGVMVGDRILTLKNFIAPVKIDEKDFFLVKEEYVMGVISEEGIKE